MNTTFTKISRILHEFIELFRMNLGLPEIYHFSKRSIISDMNYGITYMTTCILIFNKTAFMDQSQPCTPF